MNVVSPIGIRGARSPRRLLAAVHEVGPRFEREVDQLRDLLAALVPPDRLALFVVPDHWRDAPVTAGSPFAARLRGWADSGTEIFVHGWRHRDDVEDDARPSRGPRYPGDDEAEFLDLDLETSRKRMTDGKARIEDVIGRAVSGFVAPAWLYGPAALTALGDCGFALAEDHSRVWQPTTGEALCDGPVIAWAGRSGPRIVSSAVSAQLLPPALHTAPVVRIAIDPGDTAAPSLLTSLDRLLDRLCRRRTVARYDDLITVNARSCAY